MEELDVTKIEGRLKHATIFKMFEDLLEGQSFVIKNDHDPKPLYYTFQAERPREFNWEYLQQGPEWWKVKLGKKADTSETLIGDLVAADYRKADVFRKFGIDFCCGGQISLSNACEKYKVSLNELLQEFQKLENQSSETSLKYNDWSLDFLSDYIINNHHTYVTNTLPLLVDYSQAVKRAHGDMHPEVIEVASIVQALAKDLTAHLQAEEDDLFPLVNELLSLTKSGGVTESVKRNIASAIENLDEEHNHAGDLLKRLSKITNAYEVPAGACPTYTTLYHKLSEFEKDLHQHIHLENNILFKKVMQM